MIKIIYILFNAYLISWLYIFKGNIVLKGKTRTTLYQVLVYISNDFSVKVRLPKNIFRTETFYKRHIILCIYAFVVVYITQTFSFRLQNHGLFKTFVR